jgi:hypothetical protein
MARHTHFTALHILSATAISLACAQATAAQGNTEIFLVQLRDSGGRLAAGTVTRMTNRPGYDNQPHILPGGRAVLYTASDSAGQADIFRFEIAARSHTSVTKSAPESEYSATLMPAGDRFSAIRVERDSTQRLWSFRLDGTDPRVVLNDVKPVGYHAWVDANRLALFVLGNPSTLQLADVRTGQARVIAQNIGRSLHKIPGRAAISFVHREGDGPGWIKAFDVEAGTLSPIVQPFAENEYHAWTPSGTLVTARGSTLYQFTPGRDTAWVEFANLAAHGISGITRLAVSPEGNLLAIVVNL